MKHWKRLVVAGALALGGGVAASSSASAGIDEPMNIVELYVEVFGTESANIGDWLPELYVGADVDAIANCSVGAVNQDGPFYTYVQIDCPVFDDGDGEVDVTFGYRNAPDKYDVSVFCADFGQGPGAAPAAERLDNTEQTLTVYPWSNAFCDLSYYTSVLTIDKGFEPHTIEVVPDTTLPQDATPATDPIGGAAPGDFTFEIYDSEGELLPGTAVDVDPEYCSRIELDLADEVGCAAIDIAPGTYTLGEITTYGYLAVDVECGYVGGAGPEENLGDDFDGATIVIDSSYEVHHCQVQNRYEESQVTVSVDIVNDDGGTAVPSDFTMELYRADDLGTTVATGVCDDLTKVCIDDDFPIGDYVVGQTGPDGYTVIDVNQTTTEIILNEALAETNAAFTLDPYEIVTVEVVNDDPEPDPTTTTMATTTTAAPTTTMAPTTTVAPTTTAPAAITTTTAFDSAGITLPSTGNGQQSTLALAALMLLLLGGGAIALARRED